MKETARGQREKMHSIGGEGTNTHTNTHTQTHTQTRTNTHTHTHTHTHMHAHIQGILTSQSNIFFIEVVPS